MSVITAIETSAVCVPLKKATSFSNRTVTARHFGLVRVHTDAGHTGIGLAYVGTAAGELLPIAVEKILAPVLMGRDSLEVEQLWTDMYQEALMQGRVGVVMRAISAVDIALWDCNSRAAGLPLHKYLGATDLESVPVYASGGYYQEGKSLELLAREMSGYMAQGFKAVKMKTARLSPRLEEERLKVVRETVGEDVLVMMDANNAWSDVTQALEYVRRFEKHNPHFIEEPFLVDDIDSHARLARLTSVPVATGEVEAGRWRHKELLDKGGAAILQTDVAVCGGISEWRRIAAMAAAYGVNIYPHAWHDLHAPLVASAPNARFVEMFTNDEIFNPSALLDRRMQPRDGRIYMHQGPGLGFDFAEDVLRKHGITGEAGKNPWVRCGK